MIVLSRFLSQRSGSGGGVTPGTTCFGIRDLRGAFAAWGSRVLEAGTVAPLGMLVTDDNVDTIDGAGKASSADAD